MEGAIDGRERRGRDDAVREAGCGAGCDAKCELECGPGRKDDGSWDGGV